MARRSRAGVLFSKNGAQAGLGGSWRALELVGESLFVVKNSCGGPPGAAGRGSEWALEVGRFGLKTAFRRRARRCRSGRLGRHLYC